MIEILFIDDDAYAHKTLKMVLADDYRVVSALTGKQGVHKASSEDPDIILLDVDLPDMNGINVLEEIVSMGLHPPVIMLTALADISIVVKAVQLGAYDYILKPYDIKELEGTIRQAVDNKKYLKPLNQTVIHKALDPIIGESKCIKNIKNMIIKFSSSHAPVLVIGKSGSGKELVARAIHGASARSDGPFFALNCGAIPHNLIETELFGSEKGAFTDARSRPGSFELANNGTIFLDEIGEMPLEAQVKLLRVLEEKQLVRVGGTNAIPINVRVISATNKDIKQMIKENSFREDLYYRISVLPITIPDLCERREDIPLLSLHFIKRKTQGKKQLTPEARTKLVEYAWPGNVRELNNVIERALVYAEDDLIRPKDIVF
ncbi:MAG: sigma-54-dependent Fis family transcriptional regulator [Spirochaetales bacterium]|nr:sigma-54-dependent Fis family transcriptional regulator [Spirochaetales bacterium]